MSDYILSAVLVLCQELFCTRECNLVDVFVDIFGSHAYAVVAHGKGAVLFVDGHAHVHIVECAFVFAER